MYDRQALSAVLGFSFGILLYTFFDFGWVLVFFTFLLGLGIGAYGLLRPITAVLLIGVLCVFCAFGMARTHLVPKTLPDTFSSRIGTTERLYGTVIEDPDVREGSQRVVLLVEEKEATARILVVLPSYPSVSYGDRLTVSGVLVSPAPFDTNGGRIFRYDHYLLKDGIFLLMQHAVLLEQLPRIGLLNDVRGALADFKQGGMRALTVALPEPHASLAGGLILGGKQGLGKELLQDFITSGLVHIVVLSGYNVMIIADAVYKAFGIVSKQSAALIAAGTIVSFVLAAGAGAASIRAGIMACIALYARATGRTYDAFRALLFAGVLMLLSNPLTLVYDPGFQLSFIATLGLIFGAPLTERWLSLIRFSFLREIASATLAAQIAVLPLLLYQNGLFSVVALPANLLVLPVIPLAMALSAFAGVCGALVPALAPLLAFPAYAVLSYVISVVTSAAHLPFAALSIPAFPFVFVCGAYLVMGYGLYRAHRALLPVKNMHLKK